MITTALRVVAASGAFPPTVVMPSSSVCAAATTIATASSWPGSQSRMTRGRDMPREHAIGTVVRMSSLARILPAALVLSLVAGCTGGDDAGGPTTSLVDAAASTTSAGQPAPTASIVDGPRSSAGGIAPTSVTIAPDVTGVAGAGSDVPTCAAFAQINGTFQLLAVAAAFGGVDAVGLARVELVAAPAVVAAADALFATWPAELDTERAVVQDDLLGPIERRAERAVQSLRDAGATDADLGALRGAWTDVLATQARDNPEVEVPSLPGPLEARLTTAARGFADQVTAYAQDPSLMRAGVETPVTDAWLAERCPEVLAGAGGDAV